MVARKDTQNGIQKWIQKNQNQVSWDLGKYENQVKSLCLQLKWLSEGPVLAPKMILKCSETMCRNTGSLGFHGAHGFMKITSEEVSVTFLISNQ